MDAWNYVVSQDRLIRWVLFKKFPKRWAMWASEGKSADILQECRIAAHRSVLKYGPYPTAIVNATKWTLFRMLAKRKEQKEKNKRLYRFRIEDTEAPPELQEDWSPALRILLRYLPLRTRQIIELRYGLKDGVCRNLEQVAKRFNLTRSRIAQIERRAFLRLQHYGDYIDYIWRGECMYRLDADKLNSEASIKDGVTFLLAAGLIRPNPTGNIRLVSGSRYSLADAIPKPLIVRLRGMDYKVLWDKVGGGTDRQKINALMDTLRGIDDQAQGIPDCLMECKTEAN